MFRGLRGTFIRGLLLLLPLAITWLVLRWVFIFVMAVSAPMVASVLNLLGMTAPGTDPLFPWITPVIAIVITVGVVLLVGMIGGNFVGRRAIAWFDRILLKVPLLKWLYGSARQLMEAFVAAGSGAFREVVFLEYPRRGAWCLGFVTSPAGPVPGEEGTRSEEMVFVFIPTTPNLTSGYTVLVPRSDIRESDMTVDESIKLIVSGGFIVPGARQRGAGVP